MNPITERDYQRSAADAGAVTKNGVIVAPTGSGKSVIIGGIVKRINEPALVLQPSVEILESNYEKAMSYGIPAEIFSASAGIKNVGHVTYATIGSIIKKLDLFSHCKTVIIDEAHAVNAKGGQFERLIKTLQPEILVGLTATPYRLASNSLGSSMRIITRTRPKIFQEVISVINPADLIKEGYLLEPKFVQAENDDKCLCMNTTGADFTAASINIFSKKNDLIGQAFETVMQGASFHNKILVFVESVAESQALVEKINKAGAYAAEINANTPKQERRDKLHGFQGDRYQIMVNVGTLTTGYDFPALDCCVDARPVLSAALHYQKVGRIVRPFPGKNPVWYDLAGNVKRLGNPLTYRMEPTVTGRGYELFGDQGRITTKIMSFQPEHQEQMPFGKYKGQKLCDVPSDYFEWFIENGNKTDMKHVFYAELKRREITSVAGISNG